MLVKLRYRRFITIRSGRNGGWNRGEFRTHMVGENMLPKDPNMLLSVINMKLRDFYPSLDALCDDTDEDRESIVRILSEAGYTYDPEKNAFV